MRVLIVGINFAPELTGIGKFSGEMAEFLYKDLNEIRIITTPPYYPHWKVQDGYHWWKYTLEIWGGLKIWRCPLWVPSRPSGLKRLVHLFSFAISSLPVLFSQVIWKPDLILCVAPTIFSAPFVLAAARMGGAKTWLHIQDFELDAATALGMLPAGDMLNPIFGKIESALIRGFNRVSTISGRMLERLAQKGVPKNKIVLFPNWVDTSTIFPLDGPNPLKKELQIIVAKS